MTGRRYSPAFEGVNEKLIRGKCNRSVEARQSYQDLYYKSQHNTLQDYKRKMKRLVVDQTAVV